MFEISKGLAIGDTMDTRNASWSTIRSQHKREIQAKSNTTLVSSAGKRHVQGLQVTFPQTLEP